jgi:hypothetical protein
VWALFSGALRQYESAKSNAADEAGALANMRLSNALSSQASDLQMIRTARGLRCDLGKEAKGDISAINGEPH